MGFSGAFVEPVQHVFPTAGAVAAVVRLQDVFTDPNGTSLNVHTPTVGGPWVESLGDFDIQSNRANVVSLSGGTAIAQCQCNVADMTITLDVIPADTYAFDGVLFRFTDTNNYWFARWMHQVNRLEIYEFNAGVATLRASAALVPGSAGQPYSLTLVASGETVTLTVLGTSCSYASATFNKTATRHGLRARTVSGRYDNILVV